MIRAPDTLRLTEAGGEETPCALGSPLIGCDNDLLPDSNFDSIHADVIITALDSAYAAYAEATQDDPTIRVSSASVGLQGAFGIFSAIASDRRSITIVRDPPPS